MANPFTLAVLVGVSIAAVFYYVFSDSNNHNTHHEYGGDDSGGNAPNSWTQTSPRGPRQRNRRRGSNDTSNSDKQMSCTICLTDIPHQQKVEVLPCGHNFHQPCIFDWQKRGPQESRGCCPNCRMKIVSAR